MLHFFDQIVERDEFCVFQQGLQLRKAIINRLFVEYLAETLLNCYLEDILTYTDVVTGQSVDGW